MEERTRLAAAELGIAESDVENIRALYNGRYAIHGTGVETVGWGSKSDQEMRFEVLCRGLDLRGKRILDIGCGLGDFVAYARQRFDGDIDYVGIDLAQDLIEAARQQYGNSRTSFHVATMSEDADLGEFDIAVMSGTLTFRTQDNMETMRRMLGLAYRRCREALCVNFLTSYADFQLEKNFHYSPEAVFSFAKTLSRFVTLHHDYELYEFTVQILRAPSLKRVPKS